MPTPTPLLLPLLLAVSCRALGDPLAAGGSPQAGTTHSPEPRSPSPAAPHRSAEPPGAGHDDCPPLGLESLGVDDTQLSASSMERVGLGPHRGRLNIQAGIFEHDYYDGAWCADPQDPDPWLQVDGRRLIRFTGVITQGRNSIWSWHWVTSYQLLFSNDTHTWIPYGDGDTDTETPVRVKLPAPVVARYIRINPRSWFVNGTICLRAEILGCSLPDRDPYWSPVHHSTDDLDFQHHDYEQLRQVMRRIRKECPNITRTYSIGRSFQGRKMYVMEISDNPGVHELGEPEFRYVAGMHGNEVLGRDLLILLMEYLCKEYRRKNPRVRRIVDSTRIHLLPSMNPDGYEMAHRMGSELVGWVYGRWTMEGYDLNHNFANLNSVMWADEEEQEDPSRVRNHFIPIPATYRWANASVATETRAVINWMKKIPFVLSANLHGGDMVVCYPFDQGREPDIDYQPSPTPDEDVFRWLSFAYASSHRVMAQYNHRLCHGDNFMQRGNIINGANWHSMTGSMNDFSYLHTNCFEVTVELSCDKFPHYSWLPLEWDNNRESLLLYMEQVHLGIKGVVKDHLGHGIHGAVIAVEGINHHVRTAADGDYWRLLNPGHYEVTASAAGFVPSTQTCAVGYHSPPTICNFQLTRRLVSGRRNSRTRGKGTRVPSRRKDPTHHRDPFRRRRLHGH